MKFISPSDGILDIHQVFEAILNYINAEPEEKYRLIIGTDSQPKQGDTVFVTAIIIYRIGRGGRFFYRKEHDVSKFSMKQRLFYEVSKSLEVASYLTGFFANESDLMEELEVEIHLDVGEKGPTREIIKEVVGMVVGSGYEAHIKPESYAASSVADRFTK